MLKLCKVPKYYEEDCCRGISIKPFSYENEKIILKTVRILSPVIIIFPVVGNYLLILKINNGEALKENDHQNVSISKISVTTVY